MTERTYSVGYGKPPRHTRFKPGQSGNPRGRVKGRKNLATELLEELSERVIVTENGRQKKLSKQTVILKRMVTDAAQGDAKARDQLLKLIGVIEQATPDTTDKAPQSSEDAKILERFRARLIEEIKTEDGKGPQGLSLKEKK
jgi:hypothetical protein